MKSDSTPSWTDPTWTIVSADADIAHVMLPLSTFRLNNISDDPALPKYQVEYDTQPPVPNPFADTVLLPVQGECLRFYDVAEVDELPAYKSPEASGYTAISDSICKFMLQNRQALHRLEGKIRIYCHAYGQDLKKRAVPVPDHDPMFFDTLVQFYQFKEAYGTNQPVLVVRTPMSPACPKNGDGTAIGYGKY